MKKSLLFLFLSFVVLFSLDCAKKEQRFVASVEGEKITVEEFNQKFKSRVRQMPPTREEELDLRKNALERFIQQKLLAQAAIETGRDKEESFIKMVKEQEEKFLLQTLYKIEVLDKATPSERELKEFHKKQGEEIRARHILVKNKDQAEEIYQRLKEGADFEEVAKEESEDATTKDKGGDLGFFQWGRMVGPFQDAAFELKPQEISKPVRSGFGWHIIKLEERRKVEQPEYEKIKENLTSSLQRYKQQQLSYEFMEDLKGESNFKVNSSSLRLLMDKAEKKDDTLEVTPSKGAEFNSAAFTPEEKELTLASFKGGELKLGEFLENYQMLPAMRRPGLDEQLLEDLIYQMSLKPILLHVAQDKKVDESESYLGAMKELKEMTLAEGYKNEVLWKDLSATEEEMESYYEKNEDLYLDPARVKVKEIMVKTEKEAKDLLQKVKQGGDWDQLAQERTLRTHVKYRGGDLGFVGEKIYPEIFEYAWSLMKIDEIGGPVHIKNSRYGEGYSVIKLLDKKYSYQKPLKDVKRDVGNRVKSEKKFKILEDWTKDRKEKKDVKIFEEILATTLEVKE